MTTPPDPAALRARLEASRAALLDAIARLTEQDFATDLGDGQSVVALLAALAAEEREAAAEVGGEAVLLPGRGVDRIARPAGRPRPRRGALRDAARPRRRRGLGGAG